jgi:ribonucleotide reductase beta subunit family protein with ferritin-like domain
MQIAIENIHAECYSLLIDTYITDSDEKDKLFNAINTIPIIQKKANWAIKYIKSLSDKPLYSKEFFTTLIAFICVEGIFFSGSFCAIYWLKSRGLMPALSTANQFISRDENLHTEFAIELFKTMNGYDFISKQEIYDIFKNAVELEKEFICEALKVSLIGMNDKLMSQYIEYVADRWLVFLDLEKIYNSTNPFYFMNTISINDKCNFFENQPSSYNRANVGMTEEDKQLTFDDF